MATASNASSNAASNFGGRAAATPAQIPAKGWWAVLKRTFKEASDDNLSLIAAGIAFNFFLAMVPLLGALVLVYGLVADPQTVARHVQGLSAMLPADAARLIGDQLKQVVTTAGTAKGFGLLLALALAIYGAMRGAGAIITGLNIVYEEKETRGFVKTTLLQLAMTLGILGVVLGAIGATTVMNLVDVWMRGVGEAGHGLVTLLTWLLLGALVSGALAAAYRFGPDREKAKWSWLTPGSLAATLAWLAATLAFGFYVSNFGDYNATYGSLAAVVVLLLWLWLSAYVVLLGAELNAEAERQTARDTTTGAEKPMGSRRAAMADTVAG